MIGAVDYVRVTSVSEGCGLLRDHGGRAAVFAGGTDLLVNIRNGVLAPSVLVDIKGIAELTRWDLDLQKGLSIGACVPVEVIAQADVVRRGYRVLAEAVGAIGSHQIRNRATIAGNLCNASPATDSAPALLVLDARAVVAGPSGERTLAVHDLFLGPKKTALRPGEILTTVVVPPTGPDVRTQFLKKRRVRGHDLATVSVAGYFDPVAGELRVAIGSCGPTPILLPSLGEPVRPDDPLDELAHDLNEIAQRAISPISDLRGSAEYRRSLVSVFVKRLLCALLRGGEVGKGVR
ncbi:MAG: xanthine dehydrogenase family protein subunit M [Candidatus Bipolaricaulota bacterium]